MLYVLEGCHLRVTYLKVNYGQGLSRSKFTLGRAKLVLKLRPAQASMIWSQLYCLRMKSVDKILCLMWRNFSFCYQLGSWPVAGLSVNTLCNVSSSTLCFQEVPFDFCCFAPQHESSFHIQSRRPSLPLINMVLYPTEHSSRVERRKFTGWVVRFLPAEIFVPSFLSYFTWLSL
jgi:hypothetical protein